MSESVCVFVCVWTICTDVKLLSVCFVLLLLGQHDFRSMYAGGWSVLQMSPSNEDASVAQ